MMDKNPQREGYHQNRNLQAQNCSTKVVTIIVTFNPIISNFNVALRTHICTGVSKTIIIDNASQNITEIEQAVSSFRMSSFELMRLSENVGIGAAQNIGIGKAITTDCSHVILFDQDSLPTPEIVSTLLSDEAKLLADGARVGAIGPIFRDPHSDRYFPQSRIAGLLLKKVLVNRETETPAEVSFIISSGSLIRTEVLNRIGLMNEDFFIDMVDFEWCLRARAQGFSMYVSSNAVMSHSVGDRRVRSLGREISIHSPLRRYYMARNSILLARQPWVPTGYRIREFFCVIARTPVFLFTVKFNREYLKHIFRGIIHGFMGRGGKYS